MFLNIGIGLSQLDNTAEFIAYIPCYEGGNSVTAVKKDGQTILINKSIKSVIKKLLMESSINTYYLRKTFKECFGGTNLMPLPLGLGIVFIPIKVRKTIAANDGSFAYIDLSHIKDVIEHKDTIINLKCGFDISCLESVKTVKSRMKAAKLIEEKISLRFIRGQNYKEGLSDIYSEYDKAATKGDITMLAYEIMKLRDKLEQG